MSRERISYDLGRVVCCGKVREWYVVSYEEIRDFPRPVTVEEEIKFAELLKVRDARGATPLSRGAMRAPQPQARG